MQRSVGDVTSSLLFGSFKVEVVRETNSDKISGFVKRLNETPKVTRPRTGYITGKVDKVQL